MFMRFSPVRHNQTPPEECFEPQTKHNSLKEYDLAGRNSYTLISKVEAHPVKVLLIGLHRGWAESSGAAEEGRQLLLALPILRGG